MVAPLKKPFLTLGEVQAYLGIRSRKTILKYIGSGQLPAYKLGGTRWRFDPADVRAFLTNHRVGQLQQQAKPVST